MKLSLRTILWLAGVLSVVSNPCVWAHTDVTVAEARDLIASTSDLTVVDVREPYEYCDARGHIPGALNYPWSSGVLRARYEELSADGPVLVVCRSGGRSNAAASFLDSEGFQEVYDMLRGMNAWQWETAPCKYSGGAGTADDPYQIATAADLIALGETPEDYDKHFILTADIDLDPNLPGRKVFDKALIAPDVNDIEEGFQGTSFAGVFDGSDHTISHLTIEGASYLGLFGQLIHGAEISNLGLEYVDVNGTGESVGGFVGDNLGDIANGYSNGMVAGDVNIGGLIGINYGSVTASHSGSTASGIASVGGLVGENWGSIASCRGTGRVVGRDQIVGGLVGYNTGSITASDSTCTVTGVADVGGLVGNHGGNIANCHSTGTVTGDYDVGGLVGSTGGVITTSHSSSMVGGESLAGGLVGYSDDRSSITNCYSTGTVTGNNSAGGFVAENRGSVAACFSTGTVTGDNSIGGFAGENRGSIAVCYSTGLVGGVNNVGGLVGDNPGSLTASFWDVETSGQSSSAGGKGLTTVEMRDPNTYIDAGWDFVDEILNGTCDHWQALPDDYPQLCYHAGRGPVKPEGAGTAEEPYLIQDARDLGTIWFEPMAHYRMQASVDLDGITWAMAVVPWFAGTFDGNGHVIRDLHIRGSGYLGLFGKRDSGVISNLGLEAVDVNGSGDHIGGLMGYGCSGRIANCYSTGVISGGSNVGGLAGTHYIGTITMSYSGSTVSGDSAVGGLAGYSLWGWIEASYSTGMITGNEDVGGLVGYNYDGNINNSYSAGAVSGADSVGGLVGKDYYGQIIACFWDTESSGQTTSARGTGKTVIEMQTASMFLEAGWDFIDETENGDEDIWWILEGQDYPRLWWETGN